MSIFLGKSIRHAIALGLGVPSPLIFAVEVKSRYITPPEETNTDPGFNRGSGGGARGCGFEKERVGAYARTEGGRFL